MEQQPKEEYLVLAFGSLSGNPEVLEYYPTLSLALERAKKFAAYLANARERSDTRHDVNPLWWGFSESEIKVFRLEETTKIPPHTTPYETRKAQYSYRTTT